MPDPSLGFGLGIYVLPNGADLDPDPDPDPGTDAMFDSAGGEVAGDTITDGGDVIVGGG